MNKRQTTALWTGIAVLVAMAASAAILRVLSNDERRREEAARSLWPADLTEIILEPMDIWSAGGRRILTCRLFNGTNRPLAEVQVTLYVGRAEDESRKRARAQKRTLTWEEVRASIDSAREYKQEFDCIGPVLPKSWHDEYIHLSNCPLELTRAGDGTEPTHWRVILKAAKWKRRKESALCLIAANWHCLAFPAGAVVLIVGGLIFTLKDRRPTAAGDVTGTTHNRA